MQFLHPSLQTDGFFGFGQLVVKSSNAPFLMCTQRRPLSLLPRWLVSSIYASNVSYVVIFRCPSGILSWYPISIQTRSDTGSIATFVDYRSTLRSARRGTGCSAPNPPGLVPCALGQTGIAYGIGTFGPDVSYSRSLSTWGVLVALVCYIGCPISVHVPVRGPQE